MSDYDHRDLDEPEDEDDLHAALDSEEDDEQPWAKTSSGDADNV
jgi:hypothetical protein